MKNNVSRLSGIVTKGGRILLATAALMVAGVATTTQAVPFGDPTLNDWDCVVRGGGQDGVMFLHFTKDIDPNTGLPTFEGIVTYAGRKSIPSNPRDPISNGRTNAVPPAFTNLFGGGFIQGSAGIVADNGGTNDWLTDSTGARGDWFFNSKGQVVGSFFTVIVLNAQNPNGVTNDVSFVANVVPSKRLGISGSSTFGNFSANGVPLVATTVPVDQFPWTGRRNTGPVAYEEIFSMSPLVANIPIPNAFSLTGSGPSYTYDPGSFCLLSSQKKIAFAIGELMGTNGVTTGTFGKFSANKRVATAKTEGLMSSTDNRITFNASALLTNIP